MKKIFFASAILAFLTTSASARIELPDLFTDHMVLQQQTSTGIWGTAAPGKAVTLTTSWDGRSYTAKAEENGKWKIFVETPKAGGPYSIDIFEGKKMQASLKDILIGEVWLCSGQSNMEMGIGGHVWAKPVIDFENVKKDASNHPNLRIIRMNLVTGLKPQDDISVADGGWKRVDSTTITAFSATGYFYGLNLCESLGIPVGLIESCWGGTLAEAWASPEALKEMPEFVPGLEHLDKEYEKIHSGGLTAEQEIEKWGAEISSGEGAVQNGIVTWATVPFDDSSWVDYDVPGNFHDKSVPEDFFGLTWLRKTFDVPRKWAGKDLILDLGTIDDHDFTYFNGVCVGHTEGPTSARKYRIPGELVKAGKNTVAVRVYDNMGMGGITGNGIIGLSFKDGFIDLKGLWKAHSTFNISQIPPFPDNINNHPEFPSCLYNSMIHPLRDIAIKGAIWYQGESNTTRASQYRELLPLMISSWRETWGYEFPFYICQIANFRTGDPEFSWAELRESQMHTADHLANTGIICTADIGDPYDIHPTNKQEVGRRLCLESLALTYGHDIAHTGPRYVCHGQNLDGSISIKLSSPVIEAKGDVAAGWELAGPDKNFTSNVSVRIEGDTIIISSDEIKHPMAVRYGFRNNPICNIYGENGLPLWPFRTDNWSTK